VKSRSEMRQARIMADESVGMRYHASHGNNIEIVQRGTRFAILALKGGNALHIRGSANNERYGSVGLQPS
jgi:hypothetical protein